MSVNLKVGDALYYAPHRAFAVLLERETHFGETMWRVLLRSPRSKNNPTMIVNESMVKERRISAALQEGELIRYGA